MHGENAYRDREPVQDEVEALLSASDRYEGDVCSHRMDGKTILVTGEHDADAMSSLLDGEVRLRYVSSHVAEPEAYEIRIR